MQLISLFFAFIFLLIGCAQTYTTNNIDTTNLSQVEDALNKPAPPGSQQKDVSDMRMKMLKEFALSAGAQGGLAWAAQKINAQLEQDSKYLDNIFNFNAMVLSHGVIPPVLEEGDFTLNLNDPNTIRVTDRTYKIVKQARFATTPPHWREYLWLNYSKPSMPDKSLWPRNEDEQNIWRCSVRNGWQKGIEQAYSIFQQNLARLKRDYRGMVIYRKLLQEKMISQPFVARTELGITGNGDDMRINDQVLRIVELPKLQTNSKGWRPVVVQKNGQ